jgi:hypothetical protein
MRTLAFGALFVGLIAACGGGGSSGKKVTLVDSGSGSGNEACNVLAQTGCATGQKCTWIIDQADTSSSTGHIGCAPAGAMAVGASCTRNPPGATGYDDCVAGDYCFGPDTGGAGKCKQICDIAGGAPTCPSMFACSQYDGLFGPSGMTVAAGVCDPTCNPLTDNNLLGTTGNNQTTFACGSGGSASGSGFIQTMGCYGYADNGSFGGSKWTCTHQLNPTRYHRQPCGTTVATGDSQVCSPDGMGGYINGCAAGYEPVFKDSEGSTQIDCVALCAPITCKNDGTGTTSTPNCGTGGNYIRGNPVGGHECATANLHYATFTPTQITATPSGASTNGEQCFYSWMFEIDMSGSAHPSPTSETVGFCVDHSKYLGYDPSGGSGSGSAWPRCDLLGVGSNNAYGVGSGNMDAFSIGCVDMATARAAGDIAFDGKVVGHRVTDFRPAYNRAALKPVKF